MLKKIIDGVLAGIMITIGGSVYLACFGEYKPLGAILFSVALLCICYKGYSLFTGKVGFMTENCNKEGFSVLLLGLFGNAIGTVGGGFSIMYAIPNLGDTANVICQSKLSQSVGQTLIRAIFCGILMYLAVSIYKENKSVLGILFCVPVFILAGFEHSIANMFYFAASGIVSLEAFVYIWLVILGNSVGGLLMPTLSLLGGRKNGGKQK